MEIQETLLSSYLTTFTRIDPVMFSAGSISADDAHVFSVGHGMVRRIRGWRGSAGEAHERGGGRARGLDHAPGGHGGQQTRGLRFDVQRTLRSSKCCCIQKIWIHHGHYFGVIEIKIASLYIMPNI